MTPQASPCRSAIERFLARDLPACRGLGGGCGEDELAAWLPLESGWGAVRRGAPPRQYRYRGSSPPGFNSSVRWFFEDGLLRFVDTEFWSFERAECDAVLTALGAPTDTLPLHFRGPPILAGLRLYAARGIALGVMPETQLIVFVQLFEACSASDFVARYHDTSETREF